jgi:hypothetical protein
MEWFVSMNYIIVIFMFFSEYLRTTVNPELYNRYIMQVSLIFIRAFSSGQLVFIKAKKTVFVVYNNFVKSHPQLVDVYNSIFPKKMQNDIDFVVDGKIVFSTTKETLLHHNNANVKSDNVMPDQFDFIIYSQPDDCNGAGESITYKKIITDTPFEEVHFNVVKADYKFILTEIQINNLVIATNFYCYKHNYFVAGNIFHLPFIKYYLNQYHADDLNSVSLEDLDASVSGFKLRMLDQNVNGIVSDSNNQLKINKDNYEIIKL